MKVFEKSVKELIPYEFNNKVHDETQVNRIANSIKEFWFTQPIVIDKNNIVIIGHGRLEASKKLWLETVPVVMMDDLTENQIKKLRILDNKLNESQRDVENLKIELDSIGDEDFASMFDDIDFGEVAKDIEWEEEKPEIEFTEELWEESNYLVLYFDNTIDWLNAQSVFDLKPVKALDSKKGYERVWIWRVINGTKFIEKILNAENKGLWK